MNIKINLLFLFLCFYTLKLFSYPRDSVEPSVTKIITRRPSKNSNNGDVIESIDLSISHSLERPYLNTVIIDVKPCLMFCNETPFVLHVKEKSGSAYMLEKSGGFLEVSLMKVRLITVVSM